MKKVAILFVLAAVSVSLQEKNSSITPSDYVANLGIGFDATFSEFGKYIRAYTPQVPQDFAAAGFTNVRIRMNEQAPDASFMAQLKDRVQDCLDNDIYPILAYQAFEIEEKPNATLEQNQQVLANWWGNMASFFQGWDYRLSFNILIEISGKYKTNTTAINALYYSVRNAIRAHDTERIIIFAPCKLSDPDYLQYLNFTEANDPYTMAEWHFYAAGPQTDPSNKKYWNDGTTAEERNNILGPLQTAYDWGQNNNVALWVGAWMAGNYNNEGGFDLVKQSAFGSFMARALKNKNMPWSINADNKFYNYSNNQWLTTTETPESLAGMPVRDAILDPNAISLYTDANYEGAQLRLAPGDYDSFGLAALGFIKANSVMVPFDFKVTIFMESGFTGSSIIVTNTTDNLQNINIHSLRVEFLNSY